MCFVTNHTVTVPPYHISIRPIKPINHMFGTYLQPNTLLETEENPFLSIEQLNITTIPVLQEIGQRIPDKFVAILWNPGGHYIHLERNTTICYVKESDCIENSQFDQWDNVEVTEISHEKLPPMPEKLALIFHHNFYSKPKIDLEDAKIHEERRYKFQNLKQDYDDIVGKQSSDIRLTHLEEMTIENDPELPLVASKPYPLWIRN